MNCVKAKWWPLCLITYFLGIVTLTGQAGLVVPSEKSLILEKGNKQRVLNLEGTEIQIVEKFMGEAEKATFLQYRGTFLKKKDGRLTMKLSKFPKRISPQKQQQQKVAYLKRDLAIAQEITLTDIENIKVYAKVKKPIAIVGDAVGFLGGLTTGFALVTGIALSRSRPDLKVPGLIPLAVLGLGVSYLVTRIGHSKKYRMKGKRKNATYWVIKE